MLNLDLFSWWAVTISAGIAFLILVSIYLYTNSKTIRRENSGTDKKTPRPERDFIFVWVLIGLLVFYIFAVNVGWWTFFAAGNIIVEAILIAYLVKNRREKSEETPRPRSQ